MMMMMKKTLGDNKKSGQWQKGRDQGGTPVR